MKKTLVKLKNGLIFGIGLGLGLFVSYLFAVTVGTLNTFNSGSTVSSSQINDNFTTLKTAIETLNTEVTNNLVPVGTILPYSASSAPTGFLLCDGTTVSRTTYADLFNVIGTTWGSGDGSTTFNLPDGREGTPVGSGTSTRPEYTQHNNKSIASYLDDQFQGHWIGVDTPEHTGGIYSPGGAFTNATYILGGAKFTDPVTDRAVARFYMEDTWNGYGEPRIGNETRGKQFVVNFIIKY
ncbi:MAG: phage tail protein [Spirochaetota bacterium]